MNLLGLDLALLETGAVVLNSKFKVIHKKQIIEPPIKDRYGPQERVRRLRKRIGGIIKKYNVGCVFMEGYSFGSKGNTGAQMHEAGGMVKDYLYKKGIPFYLITPGRVKIFLTGNGQAKKELMIKNVFKKWKFDTDINDIADAYTLARLGQCYFRPKKCTYKYEIELIKKLRKENSNENENK